MIRFRNWPSARSTPKQLEAGDAEADRTTRAAWQFMMSETDGPGLLAGTLASATGRVVGLASARLHRFSKSVRESLVLLAGLGAEGDVHAGAFVRHRYLARYRPRMPNLRQVHLIPAELLEFLRSDGYELGPGDLGENVLTAGLDLEVLPLGTILKLGALATVSPD
jgi:hypothetical protein